MRLSVQESLVKGKSFAEKLQLIEEYGFEGIELWGMTPPEDWNIYHAHSVPENLQIIKEGLSTSTIKVSAICAYPGQLLAATEKERIQAVEDIKKRLEISAELGSVGVITVPVFGQPKISFPSDYSKVLKVERRILVDEYKTLSKHAENLGVNIILEPINRYETHLINTVDQALEIKNAVASENLKIMVDFFHMNIEEKNISNTIEKGSNSIVHIHLADSNRMLPGNGHIDFKSAFKIIKKQGYKNFLSIECDVPTNPSIELPKAVEYIRTLL